MRGASTVSLADAAAPLVLALDLGTSSLRALVYDAHGRAVAGSEAQQVYALRTTADGGAEADALALFDLLVQSLDGALERIAPRARELAAVGTSCFWHSLLGLDAAGNPLIPLLMWSDTRSAPDAAHLRHELDATAVHDRTGCPLHSSFWPAKLAWLHRTAPGIFARVARWCSFGEYAQARLTGDAAVSLSMAAGTGLLDVHRLTWDAAILAALGVAPTQLNPLRDRDRPLASLVPAFADRWPALAALPWYPALGDGACANVGSGCVGPARVALTVGTSGAMRVVLPEVPVHLPPDLWAYRLDRAHFVVGGALSNGGNLLAWLGKLLAVDFHDAAIARAGALPPDAHGLTVLPFVAGERAPRWIDDVHGVVAGLTVATRPEELLRAAMEAVAYRFALVYRSLLPLLAQPHAIVANGGALLRSPAWLQIIADTLDHALLTLPPDAEASGRGAAMTTLQTLGAVSDLAPPALDPAVGDPVYLPDRPRHARYQAGLERHLRLESLLYPSSGAWDEGVGGRG